MQRFCPLHAPCPQLTAAAAPWANPAKAGSSCPAACIRRAVLHAALTQTKLPCPQLTAADRPVRPVCRGFFSSAVLRNTVPVNNRPAHTVCFSSVVCKATAFFILSHAKKHSFPSVLCFFRRQGTQEAAAHVFALLFHRRFSSLSLTDCSFSSRIRVSRLFSCLYFLFFSHLLQVVHFCCIM